MLRNLSIVAAAAVLLTGCSDGDKSDPQTQDSAGPSATTSPTTATTPEPANFDPPKAFTVVGAAPQAKDQKRFTYEPKAGMAGTTALASNLQGLYGQSLVDPGQVWEARAAADPAVETIDATAPMTAQLNGKEAVAVAYYQRVKGSGTNKAKLQVAFRWIDPADGKVQSEVALDVTPVIGADQVNSALDGNLTTETFDAATGQVAVGVSPGSLIGAKSGVFTAFADPATKKAAAVPFLEPAGVSKGVVVGPRGAQHSRRSLAVVDALTGKVKKTGLTGLEGLSPAGAGSRHVYLYGQTYVKPVGDQILGRYQGTLYAVDPATGAVLETRSAVKDSKYLTSYTCRNDARTAVVCTSERGTAEIVGFDDTTGKKAWGYTEESANRVVPKLTAAFHGLLYAETEAGPVLLDATTGRDVPTPSATPSDSASPGGSASPGDGPSPSDSGSVGSTSPGANDTATPDTGAKPQSPTAVSAYGGSYVMKNASVTGSAGAVLMILKAIS